MALSDGTRVEADELAFGLLYSEGGGGMEGRSARLEVDWLKDGKLLWDP